MSAIEVSGLAKSYGQLRAVDGISFNVNKGEVFSLLGPNGAGKTTTIEILEGLRERNGGQVKVLGDDPWTKGYALHKKLGIIPQGFTFFPKSTPREAVVYYASLFGVKADPDEILKKVILEEAAKVWFENLSGGQKQKLGLALALVNDPELLFLDEPTTGLDPQARRNMWEVIRGLEKEGRTIMLTTHYLEEAEVLSDRVAIMNRGKIIIDGTPSEIVEKLGSGERLEVRGDEKLADHVRQETGLDVTYDKGLVSVRLRDKSEALVALSSIDQSALPWKDLRTRQDSLEDIFVRLVGGTIGEEGTIKTTGDASSKSGEGV
ncbi:ABC transporter ATP-binding protein [Candidatus Bathyarchaeota archaeon]|nr:ABC transporter ATP-binding protein [Candidatus Bathyarchaeota archaeon]